MAARIRAPAPDRAPLETHLPNDFAQIVETLLPYRTRDRLDEAIQTARDDYCPLTTVSSMAAGLDATIAPATVQYCTLTSGSLS